MRKVARLQAEGTATAIVLETPSQTSCRGIRPQSTSGQCALVANALYTSRSRPSVLRDANDIGYGALAFADSGVAVTTVNRDTLAGGAGPVRHRTCNPAHVGNAVRWQSCIVLLSGASNRVRIAWVEGSFC